MTNATEQILCPAADCTRGDFLPRYAMAWPCPGDGFRFEKDGASKFWGCFHKQASSPRSFLLVSVDRASRVESSVTATTLIFQP